ncbi:hypothetical protein KDD93_07540 [Campylobacter sp. faydin G-24]|uniref:Type II toxin-antitoxin system HicA family toxin n=1 Tax=Campylobacter anatolicus TaxID=2829105 RepID=A0ABS5HJH1_9BACT|nr:hypothetical protein [Campylobacter anatolicus]MBR8461499.1 hypothetical protein [Campylobacter anatolicus]MBR8464415.1 hypothetical protein [Campylobacter anatolicus]
MKSKKYREKLKKFLLSKGYAKGSVCVWLAGTNNKKPNGDIRYEAEKKLKHPFSAWGNNIKSFLREKELKNE